MKFAPFILVAIAICSVVGFEVVRKIDKVSDDQKRLRTEMEERLDSRVKIVAAFFPPVSPPPDDELPKECERWKSEPPADRIPDSEVSFMKDMPENERRRYTCWSDGRCDFNSITNVMYYAQDHLYTKDESGERVPLGSEMECKDPVSSDAVACTVTVSNRDFVQVSEVYVVCRSEKICGPGKSKNCCREVARRSIFRHTMLSTDPTWEEERDLYEELCDNQMDRFNVCREYCESTKFKDQCAPYWATTQNCHLLENLYDDRPQ